MLSSILFALAHLINIILNLAVTVLIISMAISWFQIDHRNQFVSAIETMSNTMCRPFRQLTRRIPGPLDFAPLCAMLIIVFLQKAVPTYLMALSFQMK